MIEIDNLGRRAVYEKTRTPKKYTIFQIQYQFNYILISFEIQTDNSFASDLLDSRI